MHKLTSNFRPNQLTTSTAPLSLSRRCLPTRARVSPTKYWAGLGGDVDSRHSGALRFYARARTANPKCLSVRGGGSARRKSIVANFEPKVLNSRSSPSSRVRRDMVVATMSSDYPHYPAHLIYSRSSCLPLAYPSLQSYWLCRHPSGLEAFAGDPLARSYRSLRLCMHPLNAATRLLVSCFPR